MNDYDDADPDEAMVEAKRRIQTVGVATALRALIDVAGDPKAPPPARATAGTAIFRAAGLFDRRDDGGDKDDLNKLDIATLKRMSEQLKAQLGEGETATGATPKETARRETAKAPPKRKKASGLFD